MTEDEDRRLLRKNLQLAEENNRMLRSLRRSNFIGGIFKLLWIAVLIGIPLYLYFTVLAPIIGEIRETSDKVRNAGSEIEARLPWLDQLFNRFSGGEEEPAQ